MAEALRSLVPQPYPPSRLDLKLDICLFFKRRQASFEHLRVWFARFATDMCGSLLGLSWRALSARPDAAGHANAHEADLFFNSQKPFGAAFVCQTPHIEVHHIQSGSRSPEFSTCAPSTLITHVHPHAPQVFLHTVEPAGRQHPGRSCPTITTSPERLRAGGRGLSERGSVEFGMLGLGSLGFRVVV